MASLMCRHSPSRSLSVSLSGLWSALQPMFVSLNELMSKSGLLKQTTDLVLGATKTPIALALSSLDATVATLSALQGDDGEREADVVEIAEIRDSHQRPIEALPFSNTTTALAARG